MAELFRFPDQKSVPVPIEDATVRAAALDIRTSCIVEAPAGSGKTSLLVQRFLKLLAEDSPERPGPERPEEVLAMTFTRKATAEMHQRIFEQLQAAQAGHPLTENSTPQAHETRALAKAVLLRSERLGWDILNQPQRLNVRSILSVCLEIANSLPILSGGGGFHQPTEVPGPLYLLAARRTMLQLGGSNTALHQALRTILLHRDGNISNCEALLAGMLQARDQWAELVPLGAGRLDDATLDSEVRPKLEQALETIVCQTLTRAAHAMPPGLLEELTFLATRLGLEPGYKGAPSPIAFCSSKLTPPEAKAEHLDHWVALIGLLIKPSDGGWRSGFNKNHIGFEIQKADATYLKQLVDSIQNDALQQALCDVCNLPPAKYPDEQWQVAKALFHVLRHALIELKLLFSERNQCDYTELALAARDVLLSGEDDIDLTLAAGHHLRHLLVDEMQDTSSSQYDLIRLLTQFWDGSSQTLFLVGDPKQSIYLFRQARVERFLRTMHEKRLGNIALTPLYLTSNFRSQATLVHDFNDTFGGTSTHDPIFPPPTDTSLQDNAIDVPFVAATSVRGLTQPVGIAWHTAVISEEALDPELTPTNVPSVDHTAQEALEIRRLIEQRLAMPLPSDRAGKPWRIAVLARARNHLSAVVNELKAHNGKPEVPFRAIDLDPLAELPEVQDALAITRALLHPADRIAWLAVLRAPWCGLSLADLLALTEDDPRSTVAQLVEERRHLITKEGQHLLNRVWPTLEQAVATIGQTALATHIERTWRSLGGDAYLTIEQQTSVRRFLALIRELESFDGHLDLNTLTKRLENLYAEPRSGNIQVDLLTIHKAKGLEWDMVLVPGLHRKPRGNHGVLLNWLELDGLSPTEDASIILAPIWGKGQESDKLNDWLRDVRSKRERAEEKRLFYVAATRAREELHLFAATTRKTSGDLAAPAHGTLLKACWPAAAEHFADLSSLPSVNLIPSLLQSLDIEDHSIAEAEFTPLALAAAAEASKTKPPIVHRLPTTFNPLQRFTEAAAHKLPYTPASALRQAPTFDRPEGSFAVRAFGNVVHRYLQVLTEHLLTKPSADLLNELPTWQPRLLTSLRGEGLSPTQAQRETTRALAALTQSLTDPIGQWILSPQTSAFTERPLTSSSPLAPTLRVDRTFLAAATPQTTGNTHTWIVDFKTATQRGLSDSAFEAEERAKYTAQLETYATAAHALDPDPKPIILALYYPLLPRLIYWQS